MISDTRRLRSLREVAARGTVTAAAAAMGYTPSAVSQQLAALEKDVGVSLLERRGRNVALTDAGRILVDHTDDVLGSIERAEAAVAALHDEPVGRVRIGALASATSSILPLALRTALFEYPRLEPEVIVHPLDENLRELRLGTIDLAIEQQYTLSPHDLFEDLEQTVLIEEPLLLLTPAAEPRATVADAADLPWVTSPPGSSDAQSVRLIAANAGISPRFTYQTDDNHTTVSLVQAGLAAAVVPNLALLSRSEGLNVAVVPGAFRIISALNRPASRPRPAITAIIDHLEAAAPEFTYQPPVT